MTEKSEEQVQRPAVGSFLNPGLHPGLVICKPERFLISKIAFEKNRESAYVISFIDRDMVPSNEPPGSTRAVYSIKATVEITETFFQDLVRVAKEQDDLAAERAALQDKGSSGAA